MSSDPVRDILDATQLIVNERWICRCCGETRYTPPYYKTKRSGKMVTITRECELGTRNWYYTNAPVPEV
jgi:hypothetical protein